MEEMNVSVWAFCLKNREKDGSRVYTFRTSGWNADFIVFFPTTDGRFNRNSKMTYYKMGRLGYTKRNYGYVPQKYMAALYESR